MNGRPHGYLTITRARRRTSRWIVVLRYLSLAALAILVTFYALPMFGGLR
jgi:drug/metabolite transporter superfamily protein YnfA